MQAVKTPANNGYASVTTSRGEMPITGHIADVRINIKPADAAKAGAAMAAAVLVVHYGSKLLAKGIVKGADLVTGWNNGRKTKNEKASA